MLHLRNDGLTSVPMQGSQNCYADDAASDRRFVELAIILREMVDTERIYPVPFYAPDARPQTISVTSLASSASAKLALLWATRTKPFWVTTWSWK